MTTIDTHTIIKELITANVPEKQAEVFVKRFVIKEELDAVEKEHSELATKADIIRLENATKADLLATKTELKTDITRLETKVDTNNKWVMGLLLTVLAAVLTLYFKS
jgi:hypothetical protein